MDNTAKNNTTNLEGTKNDEILGQQNNISPSPSSTELLSESSLGDPLLEPKGASEFADNPRLSVQDSATLPPSGGGGGYDPTRIPSSIFASKPTTPMEWSVASNESLFSIHMGNTSFTRDHVFMLYKSGELIKPEDMNNLPSPNSYPVMDPKKSTELKMAEEKPAEPAKMETQSPAKTVSDENGKNAARKKAPSTEDVRNSSSSTQSFQFPLLEANVGGSASVKVVMDKQPSQKQQQQQQQQQQEAQGQPQTPGTPPPKPAGSSWFSCFSCCSLGC